MKKFISLFLILFSIGYAKSQCQPYAGENTQSCGLNYYLVGTLSDIGSTCEWTTYTNPTGGVANFQNSTEAVTMVSVNEYGVYQFILTETNGACNETDTIEINFLEIPSAYAGIDTGICGTEYNLEAIYSLPNSQGSWSTAYAPQGGSITYGNGVENDSASIMIHASAYGTYTLVWEEYNSSNQSCASLDTVIVEFIRTPNISAGPDIDICGKWAQLAATPDPSATYGTWEPAAIYWVDGIGSTTQDPNSQSQPNGFVYDLGLTEQASIDTVQFVWQQYVQGTNFPTVQCIAKDTMHVHFYADYTAENQANVPDSICGRYIDLNSAQALPNYPNVNSYWIDSLYQVINWWQDNSYTIQGNGPNTIAEVANYGQNAFAFVVFNGGTYDHPICADTSNYSPVTFLQKPQVDACPSCYRLEDATLDNVNGLGSPIHINSVRVDTACLINSSTPYYLNPEFNLGNGSWSKTLNGINFANGTASSGYNVTEVFNDTVYVDIFNSTPGNPVGDYYVLVWKSENTNGCIAVDTLLVSFRENVNLLSGNISYSGGNFNQDEIKVELYTPDVNNAYQLSFVAETMVDANSNYEFSNIGDGNFTLRAVLEQGNYPDVVSTYYNGVINWDDANYVNLTCSDTVNTSFAVLELPALNGTCSLGGSINYISQNKTTGEPVTGAEIYIAQDPNTEPMANTQSDVNGNWNINQIPEGNGYNINVDIPGLTLVTTHSNITINNGATIDDLNFYVDTNINGGIFADVTTALVYLESEHISISIYPNPVSDYLNINTTITNKADVNFDILDIDGKVIYSSEKEENYNGIYSQKVNLSEYTQGTYILKFRMNNSFYIKKFIKQ